MTDIVRINRMEDGVERPDSIDAMVSRVHIRSSASCCWLTPSCFLAWRKMAAMMILQPYLDSGVDWVMIVADYLTNWRIDNEQ